MLRRERQALLLPSWPLVLARAGLALVLVGGMLWFAHGVYRASEETVSRVQSLGYGQEIGRDLQSLAFALRCQFYPECAKAYRQSWEASSQTLYQPVFLLPLALIGLASVGWLEGRRPGKRAGSSRWATARDLQPFLGQGRAGYYGLFKTGWFTHRMLSLPIRLRNANTLVAGAPGSGKTVGYFLPSLLRDALCGHSAIVFDYKYPAAEGGLALAPSFFKLWGRRVLAFRPFDMDSGRLDLLHGGEHYLKASQIATLIVPHDKVQSDGSIYRDQARTLLKGLVMAAVREGHPSLGWIAKLCAQGAESVRVYAEGQPWLATVIGAVLRDHLFPAAVTTLAEALEVFRHPAIERACSGGSPEEMIDLASVFREPSLLYLGIPSEEIQSGDGRILLNLVKRVYSLALSEAAHTNGGQVPVHTNVYLDEFAHFGLLEGLLSDLATRRSQNLAHHLGLQNLSQGYEVYGRYLFDAIKDTNFSAVVLFGSGAKFEEAQRWSELLGQGSFVEFSRSSRREAPLEPVAAHTHSQREVSRPLLDPQELRRLPRGEAVLILDNLPPARVRMPWIFQPRHPLYPLYRRALEQHLWFTRRPARPEDEARMFEPVGPSVQALPVETLREEFVDWLEQVLAHTRPHKVHKRGGLVTRVDLGVRLEATRKAQWEAQGWVTAIEGGLGIKTKGFKVLPEALRQRLEALS